MTAGWLRCWLVVLACLASRVGAQPGNELQVDGPADARVGVLLVHDWFGITPFTLQAMERLASRGYRVAVVDLYGGRHATTHDEAGALMKALDAQAASHRIDAALQALAAPRRKLAVFGFSMGASQALAAAAAHPRVAATVLWYGETPSNTETLRALSGPVLLVAGSKDGDAVAQAVAFSEVMDRAGRAAEIYVYPGAAHAFAQPLFNQGRTYDAAAAEAAWSVTEDFLRRRMK
jgi:carboxymethylenebutenolidase